MNSSAEELLESLNILNSIDDCSPLELASIESERVSELFIGVNHELVNGWRTTSNLFRKLDGNIQDQINTLTTYMREFSEETIKSEQKASEAAQKANDVANDILNRINNIPE